MYRCIYLRLAKCLSRTSALVNIKRLAMLHPRGPRRTLINVVCESVSVRKASLDYLRCCVFPVMRTIQVGETGMRSDAIDIRKKRTGKKRLLKSCVTGRNIYSFENFLIDMLMRLFEYQNFSIDTFISLSFRR